MAFNCRMLIIVVPSRRLDDRIRELCLQVVNAPDPAKGGLLRELRAAISEKLVRLRKLAARKLLGGNHNYGERRSHDNETHSF